MARSTRSSASVRFAFSLLVFLAATVGFGFAAADTTNTALSAPTAATLGNAATLTATVTDVSTSTQPTGAVTFKDGGVPIGTISLAGASANSSSASLVTSILAVGSHTISATYNPNSATFLTSSTTSSVTQVINPRLTAIAIALASPVTVGSASAVTFTVTDNSGGNTGAFTALSSPGHDLATARSTHAATRLPNGRVLVAGGLNSSAIVIAGAEIYDPVGGAFSATGSLNTGRTGATATLLQNGTVLVVGGSTDGTAANATNTAEIFDPTAGTFTNLDATCATLSKCLGTKRFGHSATLLSNGKVLIAGGTGTGGTALSSAEVYDPVAQTFTALATALTTPRTSHTATLLQNGKVLIAGGDPSSGTPGKTAELYDVTGASTSATGSLNTARVGHVASVLADGNVVIAGGAPSSGGTATDTLELYSPFSNQFYAVTHASSRFLSTARKFATATLLNDGTVFVVGGVNATPTTLANAETYTASFDPDGVPTVTSDNGNSSLTGNDTHADCTLALSGTGQTTCSGSVTPRHVNGGPHQITPFYLPAWVSNTPYATNAQILPTSSNAGGFYFGATVSGTSSNPQPTWPQTAGNTVLDDGGLGPLTWTNLGTPNHASATVASTTLTVNKLPVTLTANTATKTYDGTTSSGVGPTPSAALLAGDTASQSFDSRNASAVNGRTLTANSTIKNGVTDVTGDYTVTVGPTATGTINQLGLTVTAVTNTKTYDGTASAAATPTFAPALGTGDTAGFTEAYSNRNAGVGNRTLIPSGVVNDGNSGNNYTYSYVNFTTGTINQLALTVTAVTNSKTYDGSTSAAATPTFAPALGTGDTANFTEAYSNRNAGVGNKTLIPSGVVTDGNSGNNYTYSYVNFTTGTINALGLTVTAVTNTKTYDGTTSAAAIPTFAPALGTGDTPNFTETYSNRNAGVGNKTLIPAGVVTDGNSGNNYTYNYVNFATGTINQLALTVTAVTNTKTYDGTTSAAAAPTFAPALGSGDTAAFSEAYSNRNAGAGNKTLIPSGSVSDGNSGNNYTYSYVNFTTGTINALALTVTAVTNTKTYDGTTSAAGTPTFAPPLSSGDTAAFTETYSNRNAGVGNKTLVPAGVVNDGNSGNNYSYSYVNFTTGSINQLALTVSAVSNTKTYDGTTSALAIPTFAPALGSGDTPGFSEAYTNRNAGTTNRTLAPSGVVSDGNGGANYTYTYVNFTTGTINQLALTVTAVTNTKTYDGTTSAAATPTFAPALGTGDTPRFTEAYTSKSAGSGKALVASGVVNDGNSGNNYTYTFVPDTTGVVNQRSLTVSATATSRMYDTTTNATGIVTLGDNHLAGDSVTDNFVSAAFADKNAGSGKTVTVTGISITGTDAGNYALSSPTATTTGTITQAPLTVTATGVNKTYDATTVGNVTLADNHLGGDSVSDSFVSASFADKNIGTAKTVSVSGISISGADAGNYALQNTTASTTANITRASLTVTATGVDKVYDGTNAATVNLSDNHIGSDVVTDSLTGATFPDKHVGSGKTVSVTGISISGADAGNYTLQNTSTSTTANITARPITITAAANTKTYDGGTSSFALPTITTGTIAAGDSVVLSQSYTDKTAAGGKTLVPAAAITDGNGGHDYNVTAVNNLAGVINPLAITGAITASSRVYDTTTTASVSCAPTGIIGADVVSCAAAAANFSDKNVGNGKTVTATGISLSGADAGNYNVSVTSTTTANITQAPLTVTATANSKVYDGTNLATVSLTDNHLGSDAVVDSFTSATFPDKNAGSSRSVTVSGISISGADAGNYALQSAIANATATISQRPLVVSASGINKVFDAGTAATVSLSDNRVSGDSLAASYTSASFATANAGAGISVAVSGISISGTDANNYSANTTASTAATISPATSKSTVTVPANGNVAMVTFTATVGPQISGTPTGTVTFMDNGAALANGQGGVSSTVALSNGVATFTTSFNQLAAGAHKITAVYNGDNNFQAASQVAAAVTVLAAVTTSAGTSIPAQTVAVSNPTSTSVAFTNATCNMFTSLGVVVAHTICQASPTTLTVAANGSGSFTVQIGTSNGQSASLRTMHLFNTLGLAVPAIFVLPLAVPAETRRKLLRRRALAMLGLVLLLSLMMISIGCGGGGFQNPNNLQPGTTVSNATPVGNYIVQVTATSSVTGQSTTLGSIPVTVGF